jgi:hypothetical protein
VSCVIFIMAVTQPSILVVNIAALLFEVVIWREYFDWDKRYL